ncbi:MAG: hypothetical protein RSD30_07725 [Flavobacterium sp.]
MSEDLQIQRFAGLFRFRPVFNIYKSSQNLCGKIVALSSYNLLDATLFRNRPRYRIGIKANNILNEQYWVSDVFFYARPQKPFNFMINLTYKF